MIENRVARHTIEKFKLNAVQKFTVKVTEKFNNSTIILNVCLR